MTKVFLDVDGVICDFLAGVSAAHNRPLPYSHDNPKSLGCWDTEILWGITAKQFWAPCDHPGFWEGLPKTSDADEIVGLLVREFGLENITICTAPSSFEGCIPGKMTWIKKFYPQFAKRVIFATEKAFFAGPEAILVDDRDKNIEEFNNAGGTGIIVPRLWNKRYGCADVTVRAIRNQIDEWKRRRNG